MPSKNPSSDSQDKQSSLLSLPNELLLLIGQELSARSLNALIKTSKRLFFALSSQLYNNLVSGNRWNFNSADVLTFAARTGNLGAFKKVLTYVSPRESLPEPTALVVLEAATKHGHDHVLRFLLDLGVPCKADIRRRLLLSAARGNHIKTVEALVNAGADISSPCSLFDSPLAVAALAYKDDPSIVNLLYERGAYKDATDSDDETILHHLASYGNFDMMQFFLDLGSPVNATNTQGRTPLFEAVRRMHHSVVLLLLSRGAIASITDSSGTTPLHLAVGRPDHPAASAIVQLLLDYGADINARADDQTPLHLAAQERGNENTVKVLLQAGADIHAIINENDRYTPLLKAMSNGLFQNPSIALLIDAGGAESPRQDTHSLILWAVYHNLFELLKKLVVDPVNPELQKFVETQPLSEAVHPGREDILAFLLTKIAKIDCSDASGDTALLKATERGASVRTIRLLLEHGADINHTNRYGFTALMNAARYSSTEVTAFILERTSQPNTFNTLRMSALDYAIEGMREDTVDLLLRHGITSISENLLETAIRYGNPLIVQSLLNHRAAKANTQTPDSDTPLIKACAQGKQAIAEILLDAGADPNAPGRNGCSTLCLACEVGNLALVKLLLQRGANIEGSTSIASQESKPLGIAVRRPETDMTALLLAHGANPNAITGKPGLDTTPLITAAHHGNAQNIKQLLDHGASPQATDFFGRTALSHAAENGHIDAIQVLLDSGAGTEIDTPDLKGQTPLSWAVLGSHTRAVEALIRGGADVTRGDKEGLTPVSLAMRAGDEAVIRALYLGQNQ